MRTYVSLDFKLSLAEASFAQFAANVLSRIKGNPKFPTLQSLAETELPSRQEVMFRVSAIGTRQRKGTPSVPAYFYIV